MSVNREHRTSNIEHPIGSVEKIGFVDLGHACFFRHSPLTGANDEKSEFTLDRLPRASLADSLCPGLSSGALPGLQMERDLFYRAITNLRYGEVPLCATKNLCGGGL